MNTPSVTPSSDPVLLIDNASLDFGGGAGVFDLNINLPRG
jgi:hypothetical protein